MATQVSQPAVYYPERDGKPMGETDAHIQAIIDTISVLSDYFRLDPNVLVGGNMMMYYEQGNPRRSMSPDTFVVFGVPKYSRRIYKVWEEGRPPTVVFEFTSRSTRKDDVYDKPVLYAGLGVQEYFLFDPLREYLDPPLQGHQLVDGRYEPAARTADGGLRSDVLGLALYEAGSRLRFVETRSGESLLWSNEVAEARRQAEAQIAALQAELARLRDAS